MKPAKQQTVQIDIMKTVQEHQISEPQETIFGKQQLEKIAAKHNTNYGNINIEFKRLHEIGLIDGNPEINIEDNNFELSECALSPSGEVRLESYLTSPKPSRYR